MHGKFKHFLQDLDHQIENKGDHLVITVKGEPEKIAKLEKTLKAIKDLHEACCDEDGDCNCSCC